MLRELVECKHRGLQTGAQFKDNVGIEVKKAIDEVPRDATVPDVDQGAIFSKSGYFKSWRPDHCVHYNVGSVKWHCNGWTKNGSGGEQNYPGIDVGVLVSSPKVMALFSTLSSS